MESINYQTFNVICIPRLEDNLCYYIFGDDLKKGVYVDTAETDPIIKFQKAFGMEGNPVEHILTTHHHYDHDGGNNAIKRAYPNVRGEATSIACRINRVNQRSHRAATETCASESGRDRRSRGRVWTPAA